MRFKVRGGTARSDQTSLCKSCNFYFHSRSSDNHELNLCLSAFSFPIPIPPRIVECTSYDDASQPKLYDMKQIAWVLRTDKAGRHIGFTRARNLKNEEREKYDDDPNIDF